MVGEKFCNQNFSRSLFLPPCPPPWLAWLCFFLGRHFDCCWLEPAKADFSLVSEALGLTCWSLKGFFFLLDTSMLESKLITNVSPQPDFLTKSLIYTSLFITLLFFRVSWLLATDTLLDLLTGIFPWFFPPNFEPKGYQENPQLGLEIKGKKIMEKNQGPSRRFGPHTGLIFTLKITFVITEFDYVTLIVMMVRVTVSGFGCTLAHSSQSCKTSGWQQGRPYSNN